MAKFNLMFFTFTLFTLCLIPSRSQAQFQLTNINQLQKIKNGTTYIAMENPDAPQSKAYVDIIKKYWTFSKIEFIKYTEIGKYVSDQNSFFTMGGYETSVESTTLYKGGGRSGINWSNTHLYLELWTVNDKYFTAKKKKELTNKDHLQVARVELFTDFQTLMSPENIYMTDYSGEGHIRNWGTGILKNYLQHLMQMLESGKEQKLYDETINADKLKELKNQTLYVPAYVLTKFNKFTGDETKKHDEKDIMEDYKFNYSMVSTEDLNKKILDDKNPIYYLVYIKSSTDKFITVLNSQTGEVIYSVYSPVSYNIQSGDLKDLAKKIGK
jgi:hypothetical protein